MRAVINLPRVTALLLAASTSISSPAADPAPSVPVGMQMVASPEPGWPQWRGRSRDAVSLETGLLPEWPTGGPACLWTSTGLGFGYSCPIVVKDRIYLTGDADGVLRLFALDLAGKELWQATNGLGWKGSYPGARACCAYSRDRIYHLNAHGRLACFEAATGKERWARNMLEDCGARNLTWAMAENILVDDSRVFVTVGGSNALVAALDAETGQTRWTTPPLRISSKTRALDPNGDAFDQAGYGSPILVEIAGRRVLVNSSQAHVFGVDSTSGELLWTHYLPTRYWVIAATPVLTDNSVFVTAPDTETAQLLVLRTEGNRILAEPSWKTDLDSCHGGVVRVGNELFGGCYRKKGWARVQLNTGGTLQQVEDLAAGSAVLAENRLYCLSQEGEMALLNPRPEGFEIVSRFRLVEGRKSDVWAHPVLQEARLYLRYHDTLYCYDIRDARQTK